jgi:hypothetical protein
LTYGRPVAEAPSYADDSGVYRCWSLVSTDGAGLIGWVKQCLVVAGGRLGDDWNMPMPDLSCIGVASIKVVWLSQPVCMVIQFSKHWVPWLRIYVTRLLG